MPFKYENDSHAYASHERGTKKTTKEFVAYIENWMNNYPRKMVNFKSPNQMLCESI
nr:hypothetical protein [Lactococcus garvieae]